MPRVSKNRKEQMNLLWALIRDYNAIYYINLDKDTFSILYANNVVNQHVYEKDFEEKCFSVQMKAFSDQYVREEDKQMLIDLTDCKYIKKRFKKETHYAFRYRVNPHNGLEFFEVNMAKPDEKTTENYAIMTVRNCNKQARDELKNQLEIEEKNIELNKALNAAKVANQSKTEFFSRMSHDLRTPMNVILGLSYLSENENDLEQMRDNMNKIQATGKYLLSIINDSLDYQKIEANGLKLEPEIIHTKEFIDSITDLAVQANKNKEVEVQLKNVKVNEDAYILVDPIRLKQIFVNLVSNAIKFTPTGGKVQIIVEVIERKPKMVHDRITITDTGIGMSKEFLEQGIFKPFSQEHNSITSNYGGTGLGLSIVKQLIDLMGATIKVESELGEGSSFIVDIDFELVPKEIAERSLKAKEDKKTNPVQQLTGVKILLVEDHPLNAEIAIKLLTKMGCRVKWAENGQVGVDTFLKEKPDYFDLILMDIRMPVLNGLDAAKAIRKTDRSDAKTIPIIAMTANAYEDDVEASLAAGMNAHIAKPFDPQDLYEKIEEFLPQKK